METTLWCSNQILYFNCSCQVYSKQSGDLKVKHSFVSEIYIFLFMQRETSLQKTYFISVDTCGRDLAAGNFVYTAWRKDFK